MKNLLRVTISKAEDTYHVELRDDHGGPWTETFGSKGAAVFPVLLVRMSDDKAKLDQTFDYFLSMMKAAYEAAWRLKLAQRVEVKGVCQECRRPVPPGFYTCNGNGSHPAI